MSEPCKASSGVTGEPCTSQGYVVVLEVEYDAQTEREARLRAHRDAETLFQQPDVLAVTAGPKDELFPITKAYLDNEEVPE